MKPAEFKEIIKEYLHDNGAVEAIADINAAFEEHFKGNSPRVQVQFKLAKLTKDAVWERYVANLRQLIESYGIYNAIYALELASKEESEEAYRTDQEKERLAKAAELIDKTYDDLNEWEGSGQTNQLTGDTQCKSGQE